MFVRELGFGTRIAFPGVPLRRDGKEGEEATLRYAVARVYGLGRDKLKTTCWVFLLARQ
jgi:hypothetical protein